MKKILIDFLQFTELLNQPVSGRVGFFGFMLKSAVVIAFFLVFFAQEENLKVYLMVATFNIFTLLLSLIVGSYATNVKPSLFFAIDIVYAALKRVLVVTLTMFALLNLFASGLPSSNVTISFFNLSSVFLFSALMFFVVLIAFNAIHTNRCVKFPK